METIIQIECKGRNIKLVQDNKLYKIIMKEEPELEKIRFLNKKSAMIVFNEKLSVIIWGNVNDYQG